MHQWLLVTSVRGCTKVMEGDRTVIVDNDRRNLGDLEKLLHSPLQKFHAFDYGSHLQQMSVY